MLPFLLARSSLAFESAPWYAWMTKAPRRYLRAAAILHDDSADPKEVAKSLTGGFCGAFGSDVYITYGISQIGPTV